MTMREGMRVTTVANDYNRHQIDCDDRWTQEMLCDADTVDQDAGWGR